MAIQKSDTNLLSEEKLIRARIHLQKEKPFFAYLCMQLQFIEEKDMLKNSPGGVAVDKFGNLYYDPKFIERLSDEEIKGVVTHEVMHCALEHMEREEGRIRELYNISSDIIVNNMLIENGFALPKDVLLPKRNSYKIFGVELKDLNNSTSEEVYDSLWAKVGKEFKRVIKDIENYIKDQKSKGVGKGFDEHRYGNGNKENKKSKCSSCGGTGTCPKCNGKGCKDCDNSGKCQDCNGTGEKERSGFNSKKIDWKKKMTDALAFARERGDVPAGMDRLIEKLYDTYIDWRGLLYRYITSQIPVDYNWARPSKKSHSLGVYLPAVERESIDVMVAVDTSGSISQDELAEFISEISSITNSFKNVELTVIDCDCEINGVHNLKNASPGEVIDKIGKNLKGGGGTSHIPVFNWINKHKPMARFIICFTDGYTAFPTKGSVKQPVLWVVAGNWRQDLGKFPFGEVIELPRTKDN